MKRKLLIAAALTAVVSANVPAAHNDSHVRTLANQEITKRKPELRGNTGPQGPVGGATGANGATSPRMLGSQNRSHPRV